jgi:hypothetical protein
MNIENILMFIQENNYEHFIIIETHIKDGEIYSICPLEFNKTEVMVHGEIFNNLINDNNYSSSFKIEKMSKEEVILKFQLIFGFNVEYEMINGIIKKL